MNNARRKAINAAHETLTQLQTQIVAAIAPLVADLDDLKNTVEELQEEEEEYRDNMPESMQDGEKGEAAQEAIDRLTEAADQLGQIVSHFDDYTEGSEPFADALGALDDASQ